jgi:lipoate-protein ligase B
MKYRSIDKLISYEDARGLQLALVEERARDEIPDTVLFLEHLPVVTRGRGLQFTGVARERHMPVPAAIPPGIEFCESERGGDLTYHGPGQLVIYPICKVGDVAAFLRLLEGTVIEVLAGGYGLRADARESATGVWVGDRKIASIGIAVRKWVTYHGIAVNIVNDLAPFHLISPCGFSPEVMTRLSDLVSRDRFDPGNWRAPFETAFEEAWASTALRFASQAGTLEVPPLIESGRAAFKSNPVPR